VAAGLQSVQAAQRPEQLAASRLETTKKPKNSTYV
jgi:hypothetical protein